MACQRIKNLWQKNTLLELPSSDNLALLREFFIALYQQEYQLGATQLICNLSGGTKPMSLALYEMALMTEADGTEAYYMNLNDTLSWYIPKNRPTQALDDLIKLPAFLTAHGWSPCQKPQGSKYPQLRPLVETLATQIRKFTPALSQLNALASSARSNQQVSTPIQNCGTALNDLITLLVEFNLVERQGDAIEFLSEDARFFCNGGWLEELVFHTIKQLSAKNKKIQDFALGLEIQSNSNGIQNELDNAVLVDNKLIIIECKTAKTRGNTLLRDSLYKLDTLTKIGGTTGRGLLISLHPITPHDQERAQEYHIDLIHGMQIEALPQHLHKILSR